MDNGSLKKNHYKHPNQQTTSTKENRAILLALCNFKSLNRRQLNELTQIRVASLCRALKNLELKQIIEVSHTAVDYTTGRRVYHYAIKKGGPNGR